ERNKPADARTDRRARSALRSHRGGGPMPAEPPPSGAGLTYSDSIAAARTMIVLEANPAALQRRLPAGWQLEPYDGDDLRGKSLRRANLLVPFHEVYAARTHEGQGTGLQQASYVP